MFAFCRLTFGLVCARVARLTTVKTPPLIGVEAQRPHFPQIVGANDKEGSK